MQNKTWQVHGSNLNVQLAKMHLPGLSVVAFLFMNHQLRIKNDLIVSGVCRVFIML